MTSSFKKHCMAMFGYATLAVLRRRSELWMTRYGDVVESSFGRAAGSGNVGDGGVGESGDEEGEYVATDLYGIRRMWSCCSILKNAIRRLGEERSHPALSVFLLRATEGGKAYTQYW